MFNFIICAGEYFVGTFWAFVPAIIAILLALVTKQVYLSLFAGIFVGAMFLTNGEPVAAFQHVFETMANQLGNNGGILIFLVVLGIFAVLMVKSGGSKAYGDWAANKIHSAKGAQLATIGFGCMIFVDDYFNCLTVGSVMRPVTDKFKISRAKLAYLIDSTAAPICIIAPISSWAAAVAGYGDGGIMAFIKTIPFNVYALYTIIMMITFTLLKLDFFKMKRNAKAAENGDLHAGETDLPTEDIAVGKSVKGKVANLIVPIAVLIVCCVGAMIYNGWSWLHTLSAEELVAEIGKPSYNLLDMFSQCDSSIALAMGSVIALIITMIYYSIAKVMSFKDVMGSITEGFKSMVPAILILTFAWTLCALMGAKGEGLVDGVKVIDGTLNAKAFIQSVVSADSMVLGIIPFVFFVLACFISFATGTSWGTFGTLLPIAIAVMPEANAGLYYVTLSSVLAGAVYGDHVSPISDTTIMASSGAQCNHIDHVRTQFPYATIVAVISALTYLISGFSAVAVKSYGGMVGITLGVASVLMALTVTGLFFLDKSGKLEKLETIFRKKQKSVVYVPDVEAETAATEQKQDEE
ncbi:MAG: Na+/H+ antiporter NhaC family protein [Christensenellales bacterium]